MSLRKRRPAEQLFALLDRAHQDSPDEKVRALLHELQVHGEEITAQNEQLKKAQAELEHARDRYADLYDFAPIGYLSVNRARRHHRCQPGRRGAARAEPVVSRSAAADVHRASLATPRTAQVPRVLLGGPAGAAMHDRDRNQPGADQGAAPDGAGPGRRQFGAAVHRRRRRHRRAPLAARARRRARSRQGAARSAGDGAGGRAPPHRAQPARSSRPAVDGACA